MEKQLLAAMLLTLLASAGIFYMEPENKSNDNMKELYEQWKAKYHRRYGNSENTYRFEIFVLNSQIIEEHNKLFEDGVETFTLGHNEYSDLTNEEFGQRFLTRKQKENTRKVNKRPQYAPKAPESIDHRHSGIVGDVLNQGSCGSCWAFSAAQSVQAALRQNGFEGVDTSPQEIIDCVLDEDYNSDGCDGGFSRDGIVYVSRHGITTLKEYPYAGVKQSCQRNDSQTRYWVKGYIHVNQNDAEAFVEATAIRPLSAAINAGSVWFQLYKSGIYSRTCDGSWDSLNHEIVVVGYAPEYYIIKNSWGDSWGESGYIRFARIKAEEGQCGVQQDPGYPDI